MKNHRWRFGLAVLCLVLTLRASAQTLDLQLQAESSLALAAAASEAGDAQRGAIVFFQHHMACWQCHSADGALRGLGPDLSRVEKPVSDTDLVESVLTPSKVIRKGFEAISITTTAGRQLTGLVAEERADAIVIRDPSQPGRLLTILKQEIGQRSVSPVSIMPAGQMNQLASRQQFLDLIRYLIEIRDGGPLRAQQLKPDPALIAAVPLPEYEQQIDHAGLIRGWNANSLKRGEAIYRRVCANCHGTRDTVGSLPLSPRFAEWKAKNGNDPFAMYQTLTRGFGFMVPQTWMVPKQKYDVIHYIREAYLRPGNRSQLAVIDDSYLARLPQGSTFGPEPNNIEPWVVMDYGPSLINTYEIPSAAGQQAGDRPNIAYKGIAMRLDPGPGGVSRGQHWSIFDHDTLRMAAAWHGSGFIDWHGIHFDGQHQVHPKIVGQVALANPVGPGWANPNTGSFDDPRLRGRDGRPYGPLPREWGRFLGYLARDTQTLLNYTVGATPILESNQHVASGRPSSSQTECDFYVRSFQVGPRERALTLLIATMPGAEIRPLDRSPDGRLREPPAVVFARPDQPSRDDSASRLVAGVRTAIAGGSWRTDNAGRLLLEIPSGPTTLEFQVWLANVPRDELAPIAADTAGFVIEPFDWTSLEGLGTRIPAALPTGGAPGEGWNGTKRWAQTITSEVVRGQDDKPFAVDILTPPDNNPWLAQMRTTGFDFFQEGDRAAVCTWDGDVWLVDGVSTQARLSWQRIASGLFQPLGLKIIGGVIHVTCRDQIVRLRDFNRDGETDFHECFNNDHQVTEHFHEFAMGLQVDAAGNLYYAKSARHALPALVPQHGTLLRVRKDGSRTDILANGFRAANGVCLNPDGSFIVTDQEGHWNPKNRINWVTVDPQGPPRFYGNLFGYHDVSDSSDAAMEPPLCWITNAFDRSPAELLWVTSERWGPLRGSLLNLSYGYGKVFVVPHEDVPLQPEDSTGPTNSGHKQGGMVELPLTPFPTGVHRGRFHPIDGQLYVCGMFAWAGNATQPGGFYRVRYTGKPFHVPIELRATQRGLTLRYTGELDADSVSKADAFAIKTWSLKRTAEYGSKHYDERSLRIARASLSADRRTVELVVPEIAPTWCMEVRYSVQADDGSAVKGVVNNTIHRLGGAAKDE